MGVGEDRQQLATLDMIEKRRDFVAREWTREPLHVVLNENLNGGALNGTATFDRSVCSAANRHVGAQKNWLCHHGAIAIRGWSSRYDSTILAVTGLKPPRLPIRFFQTPF